jgi:hypothetical protein
MSAANGSARPGAMKKTLRWAPNDVCGRLINSNYYSLSESMQDAERKGGEVARSRDGETMDSPFHHFTTLTLFLCAKRNGRFGSGLDERELACGTSDTGETYFVALSFFEAARASVDLLNS